MKIKNIISYLKTGLDLIRLRNAIITFIGVFLGAILFSLGSPIAFSTILAAAVSASLILGAGNTLNDYFDIEIDKVNKPNRPIPSGRISKSDAFMFALALFLLGLGVAKKINDFTLGIALFNTAVLIFYAKYSKKLLLVSNIAISYLVASVFIYGAAAAFNPENWINPYGIKLVLSLTLCALFINLAREIIKDIEDMEGDKKAYSQTLPLKYGPEKAKKIAYTAAALTVLISFIPIFYPTPGFNELLYAIFIIIADTIIVASFTTKPATNQKLLILTMILALAAFYTGTSIQYINAPI